MRYDPLYRMRRQIVVLYPVSGSPSACTPSACWAFGRTFRPLYSVYSLVQRLSAAALSRIFLVSGAQGLSGICLDYKVSIPAASAANDLSDFLASQIASFSVLLADCFAGKVVYHFLGEYFGTLPQVSDTPDLRTAFVLRLSARSL